ncbi:galactonate dehydratase [Pedobacter sp. Du54]|uniref:galactonate dehydratase n=1 Tax=Pedobacter anseongensis TaxID=3133439 RepID=UPI0030964FFA
MLKITDIKVFVVNAEMRNWIFVKILTSEPGLFGWGEATLEWKTRGVAGTIEDLKPLLIGKDPREITRLSEIMNKHSFWKLGVIGKTAISGIEIALWDILGKSLNVPVWQLLGGKVRDKIRVYTHLGMGDSESVYSSLEAGTIVDKALEVIDKGYDALKVVFIPYVNYTASVKEFRHVESMMGKLRDAVGDEVDIMVDFHGRPGSVSAAVQFIKVLEPFNPFFVEEVLQPGHVSSLREIKSKINCPLATGERLISFSEFEPLLKDRLIDIAQPDLCHCGGFSEAMNIAALAAIAGVGIAPHNPLGPIAGTAAIHYDTAIPNFVIQEKMDAVPWFYDIVEGQPLCSNGYVSAPKRPGLGIEVNEELAKKYPFKQEPVKVIQAATIDDGTIVNW